MQRKKSGLMKILMLFLVLGVVGFLGFKGYVEYLKSPVDKNASVKAFVIQPNETTNSIAERLEKEGFVRSGWVFKQVMKESGKDSEIEAGDFKIASSMSTSEIVKTLTEGAIDKWVTIIEGWRVEQVARQLNEQLGVDKEEFLKASEEGYMFPDTYLFNPDATSGDIASILRNTFDKRYDAELQSKIRAKGLTPEQGVILGSLVEREGRSDKVRTEVAGVLLKRLKIGMKLDVDATVQYAKDTQAYKVGKLEKFWQSVRTEDYKKVVSPYNTYLNNGLPPGPICNPSLASLKAVAEADNNSPYLYYYHDSKGNSYYAKTLEEHNENVAAYP